MNTFPSAHPLEPELLRAAPRAVRRKKNSLLESGCLGLFLLPFVAVGIGSLVTALLALLVVLLGQNVPATITSHHTSEDDEDGTSYYLDYSYLINGVTRETTQSVSSGQYNAWHDGDTLMARVLPQVPSRGAQLQFFPTGLDGTRRGSGGDFRCCGTPSYGLLYGNLLLSRWSDVTWSRAARRRLVASAIKPKTRAALLILTSCISSTRLQHLRNLPPRKHRKTTFPFGARRLLRQKSLRTK